MDACGQIIQPSSKCQTALELRVCVRFQLKNRIIDPGKEVGRSEGEIVCDERLGGLLRYYRRAA